MSSGAFLAALSSVGTAAVLVFAGFYLHRRNMVTSETKESLTRFSQQIALPSLFFSKLVRCGSNIDAEDGGTVASCTSVLDHFRDAWVLLLWPFYICSCGLLVGYISATYFTKTPISQRGSVMVATAFANSNSLPITLLTVIDKNLRQKGIASSIGPEEFISIYLVLYPVLQWSIGGWMLANEKQRRDEQEQRTLPVSTNSASSDAAASENDFSPTNEEMVDLVAPSPRSPTDLHDNRVVKLYPADNESTRGFPCLSIPKFLAAALQPPVVGSLLGLFVAAIPPVRALFVDITAGNKPALLGWLFDAIVCAGQASVPVGMAVLGANLSLTVQSKNRHSVASSTVAAVLVGKMIILPLIGIFSSVLLQRVWHVPKEIFTSFFLVLAIEWLPPTANNVMIMVELTGSNGMKEAMARIIGFQYLAAPLLLSLWVMAVVRISTIT